MLVWWRLLFCHSQILWQYLRDRRDKYRNFFFFFADLWTDWFLPWLFRWVIYILFFKFPYTLCANNDETNFLAKKCVSTKPIHEQRTASAHYSSFVICSDENCFAASRWRIFPFSFVKKPPHQRNSDETLATKNRFAKWRIMVYTLFVFRLLFVVSLVFCRYSRIVYSGLYSLCQWYRLKRNQFFKIDSLD